MQDMMVVRGGGRLLGRRLVGAEWGRLGSPARRRWWAASGSQNKLSRGTKTWLRTTQGQGTRGAGERWEGRPEGRDPC